MSNDGSYDHVHWALLRGDIVVPASTAWGRYADMLRQRNQNDPDDE